MADVAKQTVLQEYVRRLVERAEPTQNDKRHFIYTQYVNTFLNHFPHKGLCESSHLVGSTGEHLKLPWSKDGGDSDFIFCSGKLEIPVENIEHRSDTPCFVRIKGNNLKVDCSFVNDRYLPSDLLRSVNPVLFTFLRGIYLIVTCTSDSIPGDETRITTTGTGSKVGLARTEFSNLQMEDSILTDEINLKRKKLRTARSVEAQMMLRKRRKATQFNAADMGDFQDILEIINANRPSGDSRQHIGNFGEFAHAVHDVLQRQKEDEEDIPIMYENDLDAESSDEETNRNHDQAKRRKISSTSPSSVKATYREKTSKDFVPAIKIAGKLPCMERWGRKHRQWPCDKDVNDICESDVYVVSKYAPVDPDMEADFCLSFNQAEVKLTKCMFPVQRKVMLVLKSYLKGVYSRRHKKQKRDLKLTTYHMKTSLYQVSRTTECALWSDSNILEAIHLVMKFVLDSLKAKRLEHYFIESNLFAGIPNSDIELLIECTEHIIAHPIDSIGEFFALDDGLPVDIMLTVDEVASLAEISSDGGQSKHADVIEDAMIDFQRGFNDGPRDEDGRAPVNKAVVAIMGTHLELEGPKLKIPDNLKPLLSVLPAALTGAVSGGTAQTGSGGANSEQSGRGGANSEQSGRGEVNSDAAQMLVSLAGQLLSKPATTSTTTSTGASGSISGPSGSRENPRRQTDERADMLGSIVNLLATQDSSRTERRKAEDELKDKAMSFLFKSLK